MIQVKGLPLLEGEGRGEVFKKVIHPVVIIIRASSQSKKIRIDTKKKGWPCGQPFQNYSNEGLAFHRDLRGLDSLIGVKFHKVYT